MSSTQPKLEPRDIAISRKARLDAARYLDAVLGDTYKLMIETQILHWNIRGPLFLAAHELSEVQYKNMFAAVDVIAERARALGQSSPAQAGSFPPPAQVSGKLVSAEKAIEGLVDGHEALVKLLREAVEALEEEDDLASADFLVDRLAFHEKSIWMWRALAGDSVSLE